MHVFHALQAERTFAAGTLSWAFSRLCRSGWKLGDGTLVDGLLLDGLTCAVEGWPMGMALTDDGTLLVSADNLTLYAYRGTGQ